MEKTRIHIRIAKHFDKDIRTYYFKYQKESSVNDPEVLGDESNNIILTKKENESWGEIEKSIPKMIEKLLNKKPNSIEIIF